MTPNRTGGQMIQDKIPQKPKKPDQEQGFTMLEVLFSILIIFAFLMGSLQAMVYAAVFRVKALEKSEATTWIQQDLEYVRYKAYELEGNEALCDSGYAQALIDDMKLPDTETKELFPKKTYTLIRTFTPSTEPPFDRLIINYRVPNPQYPDDLDRDISTIDTEVIPNAAFDCT